MPFREIGWNFYIILLSKSDKFWRNHPQLLLSSLPQKIIPMDSIFTYYRSILERFSQERSRCLAHNDKHLIRPSFLRERDHLVRERPAVQGHLLHSLVDAVWILYRELIGCQSKPVSERKPGQSRGMRGSTSSRSPLFFKPNNPSRLRRYIQLLDPVYQVQPPCPMKRRGTVNVRCNDIGLYPVMDSFFRAVGVQDRIQELE